MSTMDTAMTVDYQEGSLMRSQSDLILAVKIRAEAALAGEPVFVKN